MKKKKWVDSAGLRQASIVLRMYQERVGNECPPRIARTSVELLNLNSSYNRNSTPVTWSGTLESMHRVLKRHDSLMNSYAQRRWDHSVQHVFDLIQLYSKNRLDILLTGNSDTLYRKIKKTHTHACEIRENYSILSHGEERFKLICSDEPASSNNSATQ